jgi:hypothetical protein
MELLREEGVDEEVKNKYQALVDFLQSPESKKLRDQSERYLAEGKKVSVVINVENNQPKYELKVE